MKSIMLAVLTTCSIFMFSGCSTKVYLKELGPEKVMKDGLVGKAFYVQGKETWRSPSAGYNVKTRNIHLLQNAANATLENGYSYFAISSPQAISNYDNQASMNTAQEFIEKCTTSEAQIFNIGNSRCGFDGEKVWADMRFVAFKEKPHSIFTYDAREVIMYLKETNNYRDDGYDRM